MEKSELPLTYETLFEVLMHEKSREELQLLEPAFYHNLREYIQQKQTLVESKETDPFSLQRIERSMQQLKNIRRLTRELYDRRERKILNMALVRSRTGMSAMDLSLMLEGERILFEALVVKLDAARTAALDKFLDAPVQPKVEESRKTVRFVNPVPQFVGRNLSTYGPYEAGVTAELPDTLANILIGKGNAEQV